MTVNGYYVAVDSVFGVTLIENTFYLHLFTQVGITQTFYVASDVNSLDISNVVACATLPIDYPGLFRFWFWFFLI